MEGTVNATIVGPDTGPTEVRVVRLRGSYPDTPLSVVHLTTSEVTKVGKGLLTILKLVSGACRGEVTTTERVDARTRPKVSYVAPFFFFSVVALLSVRRFRFYFMCFSFWEWSLGFEGSKDKSPVDKQRRSAGSYIASLPLSFVGLSNVFHSWDVASLVKADFIFV